MIADVKDWMWLIGPALSFIGWPALLWWLQAKFVLRAEMDAVKKRLDHHEARLDGGERRFAAVEAAIREVTHAADDAKKAAQRATEAAEKIGDIRVQLAELGGEIRLCTALLKRVERDADRLIDGHLDTGDA